VKIGMGKSKCILFLKKKVNVMKNEQDTNTVQKDFNAN